MIALSLLGLVALVSAGSPPSCPNGQLSCHNTSPPTDTCCFVHPGGQLLLTQFWDTAPSTGPADSWTVHGLWPDHCDGTYDSNCDPSRAYTDITGILTSFGKTALLSYMQTYWKDYNNNDDSFWQHEWSKHGTCISTLNPSCYTNYQSKQEIPDFFQAAVTLFQTLPSYQVSRLKALRYVNINVFITSHSLLKTTNGRASGSPLLALFPLQLPHTHPLRSRPR